jgi:hypothetical protein
MKQIRTQESSCLCSTPLPRLTKISNFEQLGAASFKKDSVTAAAGRRNRITGGSLHFKTRQVFACTVMNIKGRSRSSEGNILYDVFITARTENKGLIR